MSAYGFSAKHRRQLCSSGFYSTLSARAAISQIDITAIRRGRKRVSETATSVVHERCSTRQGRVVQRPQTMPESLHRRSEMARLVCLV